MDTHRTLATRSRLASKRHSFLVGFIQMILVSINIKNMVFAFTNTLYLQYVARMYIHSTFWERISNAFGAAAGIAIGIAVHYYVLKPYALTQLALLK